MRCRDPGRVPTGLLQHRVGEVDADDPRLRKAAGERQRARAGARAEVEHTRGRLLERVEPRLVRRERVLHAHRVPHRCQRVELPAHERAKQLPEERAADGRVRREPREAPADGDAIDHAGSKWIRTSWPGLMPNIAAALPPLIAIERLRYESSYRIRSPGRASANVLAATA